MQGVLLAGGTGTRLAPLTLSVNKQLLPVFDKPLIYYPLSTLMLAGIQRVALISSPRDLDAYRRVLGSGHQVGIHIDYVEQPEPGGIAQAIPLSASVRDKGPLCLVLGDNIFHGPALGASLARHRDASRAHVFAYEVAEPSAYAVVELSESGVAVSLEEKPSRPRSRLAIPGLYFFPSDVDDYVADLIPSARGELEITDLNRLFMNHGRLSVEVLPRGTAWMDAGTVEALSDAGVYIRVLEERQGLKIGCIEEVAWRNGWIGDDDLLSLSRHYVGSGYGEYLAALLERPGRAEDASYP